MNPFKKPYGLDHPTWGQPTCFHHDTYDEAKASAVRTYGDSAHIVIGPVDEYKARAEAAEAERDAYRKAKQENDDRFQTEALEQRERAEAAERKVARVQAELDSWDLRKSRYPTMRKIDASLRAALADEVDDSNDESSAQTTGHAGSQEADR